MDVKSFSKGQGGRMRDKVMKEVKQNAGFMKKLHANVLACKPTEIYNIK